VVDVAHIVRRFADPFGTESRFFWPAVIAVLVAMAAHTAWYAWRPRKPRNPVRDRLEDYAYWTDLIALVLLLVAIASKARVWVLAAILAIEWTVIAYLYVVYARPRFAAWAREQRLRRYMPSPRRRAARR
jgi:hypothetical protein